MPPLDKRAQRESAEANAQINLIKTVFDNKLPVYLVGGYADDALLHQRPSRPHEDVDFVARRVDADFLKESFVKFGFKVREETVQHGDRTYDRLVIKGKHLHADVFLLDSDERGKPFAKIHNPATNEQLVVHIDEEMLSGIDARLGEITVTTVSPLAQIRAKGAQFQIGMPLPSREKDVRSKKALVEKFYPGEDPEADKFKVNVQKL